MSEWHPIEEFDPSWSWRFKWGYSAQRDRAHAWRIPDSEGDGHLTHREEFAQTFGHRPFVRVGDQLGTATYIPEERKYDGTLVAPPEIQMHTYYGGQPHDKVYEWFLHRFPDTIVRKAYVGPEQKVAAVPQTIDWTWTEAGPEIGKKTFGPRAWTGRATITPTSVEIVADREMPQQGVAAIKGEFAKQYPDATILLPSRLHEMHQPRPSGLERQRIEQRHEAALQWAETYLPISEELEEPLTVEQAQRGRNILRSLFGRKKTADADMEGAMVGIFIPKEVGRSIKVRGGEPLENLHITLAYFTEKAADRDDWDEVAKIVETIANQTAPLTGKIGGYGVFQNDDEPDVLWASPNVPGLEDLRQKVVEAVEDAGFKVSDAHGWVPHITIKYDFKGKLPRVTEENELALKQITFARGEDKEHFDLTGDFVKETSWEMSEWSWPGTHRFITDGKEILLEPEDQSEWQPSSLDGLHEKFRSFYPDSKKTPASGWAIPTADGMGYGVWAPKVGWGGDKELGLHDLIHKLDRELKKPTHLVEEWGHIIDPKLYASTHPD